MENTETLLQGIGQQLPKRVIGDAGYGSEQNYDYIEQKGIENYLKYPGFFREQKRSFKQNTFHAQNLFYNEKEDFYVCPMGQRLTYRYTKNVKSKLGYESKVKVYQAQRCQDCPLRGKCHKAKTNRIINRNPNLQKHRKIAKENLWSLRGIRLRKQRNCDVEPVFGHIKHNRHFKRFTLRSLSKVSIEFGLLAIAHNIKKWWAALQSAKIVFMYPKTPNTPPNQPKTSINQLKNSFLSSLAMRYSISNLTFDLL